MGLNMDVDHVAFAALSKFDGHASRALAAQEVAQIAGRAGRHMNDGTFGLTAELNELDPDIVARVEGHEFPALPFLFWRNTDLRFTRVETLLADLKRPPPHPSLVRPPPAEDQLVLDAMLRDGEVRARAASPQRIRLLWDVAQVPDFRKLKPEQHARLMAQVFAHLSGPRERMPGDWVAAQVKRIERTDGDIHALMDRIAAIRTWTYLTHRPGWTEGASEWQERTRQIEDKLSDALHHKLTHQFVDRRTAHLVRRLRADEALFADVADDGAVHVDGHKLGQLKGLRFKAEHTGQRVADRAVINAANAALRPIVTARVDAICAAEDGAIGLDDHARIVWDGDAIARLVPGSERLKPHIQVFTDERVDAPLRLRVDERLKKWLADHVALTLGPMVKAAAAAGDVAQVPGYVRGIVFQLSEGLGAIRRDQVDEQLRALTEDHRKVLAKLGIRFGLDSVFYPALLKAAPIRLRGLLWIAAHPDLEPPALPAPGRVSIPLVAGVPGDFYAACGFRPIAGVGYRIDMLERFAAEVRKVAREGAKVFPPATLSLLGITAEGAVPVLKALGFHAQYKEETGLAFGYAKKKSKDKHHQEHRQASPTPVPVDPNSPFAKLREMMAAKAEPTAPEPAPPAAAQDAEPTADAPAS
jgi:ATP-dependent RNA helicase SUPV3L1/SUV3